MVFIIESCILFFWDKQNYHSQMEPNVAEYNESAKK